MLRLVIRVDGREQVFDTELPAITFGRSAENTIQVTDPKSSRLHCRIEKSDLGWKLVDLESSNGTAVNGEKVNARLLKEGDRVTIGAFEVVFSPPVAAPAPAPGHAKSTTGSGLHVAPQVARVQAKQAARETADAMGFIKVAALAAVLLVAAVVGINKFASGGKATEQRNALTAAMAMADKGDLDLAEKALVNLMGSPLDSGVHRDAKKALDDVRGRIAKRDADRASANAAALAANEAKVRAAELESLFNETTASADQLVAQEEYGAALDAWKQFGLECPDGEVHEKAAGRMKEILAKAEAAWAGVQERANRLSGLEQFEEAAALITSSMSRFKGTRFYYEAQDKVAAINRLAGVNAAYAGGGSKLSARTEESLLTISDLVRARRYGDALKEFDKMLIGVSAEERPALEARRTEIAAQASLFDKLIAAVNSGTFGAHPVDMGAGVKATLVKATSEAIEIAFKDVEGKGGTSAKKWHQVSGQDMLAYFSVLDLTTDDRLSLAAFCYSNGLSEEGSELLNQILKRDPARQQFAFQLIARHRGIPVPEEGFTYYDGGWYTKSELSYAKLDLDAKKGAGLVAQVDAKKAADGFATWQRLNGDASLKPEFKSAVRESYVKALKARRLAILRQLQNSKSVVSASTLRELKKELIRRRETAIKVIYDKDVYPDADHGKVGQPKVDEAVNAVRSLWDNPLQVVGKLSTGISDLINAAEQTDRWLAELGSAASSAEQAEVQTLLANVNEALSLKNFCLDGGERSMLEKYKAIMAYNERHPGFEPEEKACIRATNEYRFMMGRQALEAHDLLGKGGRKHSVEMMTMKYFSHDSPTAGLKSPTDRCRKEGYGGAVGENIAMGMSAGKAACDAWYNSSGHHRNMLSDSWNQIGVGKSGTYWTENLGRGGSAMSKEDKLAGDGKKPGTSSGRRTGSKTGGQTGGATGGGVPAPGGRRTGVTGGSTGGSTGGGGGG